MTPARAAFRPKSRRQAASIRANTGLQGECDGDLEPDCIYVLMHGTWASGARWCQKGSAMRSTVREAERERRVRFAEFRWTGRNSTGARLAGAEALRERLRSLRKTFPGVPVSLVAHSHAGNIALLALRDYEHAKEVEQVICLSTPFIHAAPRKLGRLAEPVAFTSAMPLAVGLAALAVWGLVSLGVIDGRAGVKRLLGDPAAPFDWIPVAFLFTLAGGILLFYWLFSRLHEYNRDVARALWLPSSIDARTLLLRNVADEAGSTLGAAQALSWLMGMGLSFSYVAGMPVFEEWKKMDEAAWPRRMARYAPKLLFLALLFPVSMPLINRAGLDGEVFAATPLVLLATLICIVLLGAFVGMFLMPVVVVGAGLCMAAFGLSTALGAVSLHLSAESSPPGGLERCAAWLWRGRPARVVPRNPQPSGGPCGGARVDSCATQGDLYRRSLMEGLVDSGRQHRVGRDPVGTLDGAMAGSDDARWVDAAAYASSNLPANDGKVANTVGPLLGAE